MWDDQAESAIRNALLEAEEFDEPMTAYAITSEATEILMADAGGQLDETQAHAEIEAACDRLVAAGKLSIGVSPQTEWRLL